MKTYISLFLLAAALAYLLTPLVIRFAIARNLLDQPDNTRRHHTRPVPRLGGIAIYSAFVLTLTSLFLVHNALSISFQMKLLEVGKLLLPCTMILVLGIYDDIRGANAPIKFGVQIVASLVLYALGFRITEIWQPFGGIVSLGLLDLPVTVLWLVGISNAFNLIDGLDGLSAGAALFALLTVSIAALIYGHPMIVILALSLAGATLGFLRYNFAPARIFMGDSGSLFLGFTLAALAIEGSQKSAAAVAVAIPIVSFGLPIVDTSWAIIRRLLNRRPLFDGDLEHIHHMMLKRGLSTRQAIILLYGVSASFGLISLLFLNPQGKVMGLALFAIGLCVFFGIQHLGYHEAHELRYAVGQVMRHRRVLARNIHLRRMAHELSQVRDLDGLFVALRRLLASNDFDRVQLRLADTRWQTTSGSATTDSFVQIEDDAVWSWCNPEILRDELGNMWMLQIPLSNAVNQRIGDITFYRHLEREPLQLDTYHFCTLLQEELSQALIALRQNGALPEPTKQTQAKATGS